MKLTPTLVKQRAAIAVDVIKQINGHIYQARQMVYVRHDGMEDALATNRLGVIELQTLVKKKVTKKQPCGVCALGAAFISGVRLFDNFKVEDTDDLHDNKKQRRLLTRYFTKSEIELIEACFEENAKFIGGESVEFGANAVVDKRRDEFDSAVKFAEFLDSMQTTRRLLWLFTAVGNLAGQRITLRGLRDQRLVILATDPAWRAERDDNLGW
jgi:hypothetical protein